MCAKWVPKLWILSEKSKNFDKKSEPNQSKPNQSKPNQSKPNQSKWNFLKSPRAPWSYFWDQTGVILKVSKKLTVSLRELRTAQWRRWKLLQSVKQPQQRHCKFLCVSERATLIKVVCSQIVVWALLSSRTQNREPNNWTWSTLWSMKWTRTWTHPLADQRHREEEQIRKRGVWLKVEGHPITQKSHCSMHQNYLSFLSSWQWCRVHNSVTRKIAPQHVLKEVQTLWAWL